MAESSSLYSAVLSLVRTSLGEASAVEWTDAQLITYISNAEQWMASWLGRLPGNGRFIQEEDITLAADAETVALSSLPSNATKTLISIDYIHFQNTANNWTPCDEIQVGDEARLRGGSAFTVSGDVAPAYQLRRPNLFFLPISTAARTLKVRYQWLPIAKTTDSDSLETPSQYDDMIVARVLFYALGDEGEEDSSFEKRYAGRLADIEMFEANAQRGSGRGESVANYDSRYYFPY